MEYSAFERDAGRRTYPLGDSLRGYLAYDASGHVMFGVVSPRDSAHQLSPRGSDRGWMRPRFLPQNFAGFFGTYTIDRVHRSVTHRLEGEHPSGAGTMEIATPYRVVRDTLTIGSDSTTRWLFVRASAQK